jgi:hypothetical protein
LLPIEPPPLLELLPLSDSGLWRIAMLFGSPVLPLSVEFVAGGEGSPEPLELPPGLGGSGRSGTSGVSSIGGLVYVDDKDDGPWLYAAAVAGLGPIYTAERRFVPCLNPATVEVGTGRGGIESSSSSLFQQSLEEEWTLKGDGINDEHSLELGHELETQAGGGQAPIWG